ncbi:MAG: DUF4286 family protein [Calditrichaeota bacterium]|nr:DUF4286 family protein [Calditrichota bacterium]
MIIYEVNLDIDRSIETEYAAFMAHHIDEMLQFDGFESAEWFEREGEGNEKIACWTVHYHLRSMADLEHYFEHHAARMRSDGKNKFGDRFTANRRILRPKNSGNKIDG